MTLAIRSSDRLCVAGLPHSGKTVFMRYLATLAEPNVFIIDPLDQYSMFPDKCRYIPKRETPDELEQVCKWLWSVNNVTLVVEEAEQYISQGRALMPYTSGLIRMGRNWGIGVWATTRRIQDINKRFFDLAQHVILFRCGLKSRDYIGALLGYEFVYPAAIPKYNKTGFAITTLPPFHALAFNLEDESAQVVTISLSARPHLVEVTKKSGAHVMGETRASIDKAKGEELAKAPAEKSVASGKTSAKTR